MMVLLTTVVATLSLLVPGVASAQLGSMMNGGDWAGGMGEYGGSWWLILCVVVAVGVVVWIVSQKRK